MGYLFFDEAEWTVFVTFWDRGGGVVVSAVEVCHDGIAILVLGGIVWTRWVLVSRGRIEELGFVAVTGYDSHIVCVLTC